MHCLCSHASHVSYGDSVSLKKIMLLVDRMTQVQFTAVVYRYLQNIYVLEE